MDIKNKSQFIEYFSKGIKSQNNLKIGVEHERFLFEGELFHGKNHISKALHLIKNRKCYRIYVTIKIDEILKETIITRICKCAAHIRTRVATYVADHESLLTQ